ncbi:MAG: flagellin [Mariprofundus sp.]
MLSVQTNNAAMTALKNLNTNSVAQDQSLNRLSSGFRINSAADDASGFAISSKLDAQSGRLKAASQNATQATAMVKMADAGVNEIQNMVSRIQTLATQAASSNNAGELGKLDAERVKLESQIDKIANATNYNGVNLLNGQDSTKGSVAGTVANISATPVISGATGTSSFVATGTAKYTENASFSVTTDAGGQITSITSASDLHDVNGVLLASAGTNLATVANTTNTGTTASAVADTVSGITITNTTNATPAAGTAFMAVSSGGATFQTNGDYAAVSAFQVGADNNANNQITIDLRNKYTTASLGLGSGTLTTQAGAQKYIDTAKIAMNTLITQRADLGATQNQLGFVQANLATSIEQSTASVSAIRDADMATEMANFTKNKILTQAGTSMLAQANQAAQNVLTLFR